MFSSIFKHTLLIHDKNTIFFPQVLDVFENTSDELLKVYENFCDNFRNTIINREGFMPCSPANNMYSW